MAISEDSKKAQHERTIRVELVEAFWERLGKIAEERYRNKKNYYSKISKTNTPKGFSGERWFEDKTFEAKIGIYGEGAFHMVSGLPMNNDILDYGDDGKDFEYQGKFIDVKTARNPGHLLVKEIEWERSKASYFVQAGLKHPEIPFTVDLIGWETREEMMKAPKRDWGRGILNHYKKSYNLKPIGLLLEMIKASPRR